MIEPCHVAYELSVREFHEDDLESKGTRMDREINVRKNDDSYRLDALGGVLARDNEAWLYVWTLMRGSEIERKAARAALEKAIDAEIERELLAEFEGRDAH